MSDIYYDMGEGANLSGYRTTLQETITAILKKIGVSDDGIEWVIVEEEKLREMDKLCKNKVSQDKFFPDKLFPDKLFPISFFIEEKNNYGRCNVKTNTIWISTAAIQKAPTIVDRLFPRKEYNLLVEVILDELAHIMTKRDHDDEKYEETLASYKKKYYG